MRKFGLALVVAVALGAGATMVGTAQAAPMGPSLGTAADGLSPIVKAQLFVFGGHEYCWYDDGWNGPGWYWCGQYLRPGFGWGGGWGWHNWHHSGWHSGGPMGGPMGPMGPMGPGPMGPGPMGPMGPGPMGPMGPGPMGPMVSDIGAKHDIVLLGHLDNGLGFYRFSYNGSDKAYVGVMAQEVQAVMPNAVVRGSDGYLRVYYDQLGLRMQTWEDWIGSGAKIPATAASLRQ
jgi:hypothetical protein